MARQVDIKALVSHVIRGDGINRCRICMGDTSEGQIYLSDTVLMDGEKSVTLSELLEIVCGLQMQHDDDLPNGVCTDCSKSAVNAAEFRTLCHQAVSQWDLSLQLLQNLPSQYNNQSQTIFAIIDKNKMIIIKDDNLADSMLSKNSAVQRLRNYVKPKKGKKDCVSLCKCPNCGKEFQYPLELSRHLKESTDLKRACHICAKIMFRDDLLVHTMEVHEQKLFKCEKCPALLLSYNNYMRHLMKAHTNGTITCIECGRSFHSSNALHAHVSIHRSKRCPSCDELFRNQMCYVYHVRNCCNLDENRGDMNNLKQKVTKEVKNEKSKQNIKVGLRGSANRECICDHCGKKFAGKKFVAAHIQIVHMKNTHCPCVYCGKLLAAAHMTQHVKIHEPDSTFTCQHCNLVLKTKLGYTQHIRLHTGERPYKCKYCGETFSASSRRSEHIRKTHKRSDIVLKQKCHLCPAKFRLPYRLKMHLKSVHNDANDKLPKYECQDCHEKFGSCRGLLHHSRKHQNLKYSIQQTEKSDMFIVLSESNNDEENVEVETELPSGLCCNCINNALSSWQFQNLCLESDVHWKKTAFILSKKVDVAPEDRTLYIGYNTLLTDSVKNKTTKDAIDRLNFLIGSNEKSKIRYTKNRLEKETKFKCEDCGKEFALPYFLNYHLISTKKRACTLCGEIISRESLAKHLDEYHSKIVVHCDICYQLFDDHVKLERHNKEYHGPRSFQCNICKNGYKNERSLRAHLCTHTLFDCNSCNTSFENRKCFFHHSKHCKVSKSSIEGVYECNDCGNVYTKKPSLRVHIIQKHLNILPYVCQICGKRSASKSHHKSHELIHTTQRKFYKCYCGAKLTTAVGLSMHKRIHSGEKPFKCDVCGENFISSSRRLDHVKRKHRSKELAHGCDKCDGRFVRPFDLRKHYRVVHSITL